MLVESRNSSMPQHSQRRRPEWIH